jgi:methionyl-tRNA synthetase
LLNKDDEALLASADAAVAAAIEAMDNQLLHEAVGAIWEVVGEANRYFAAQEPWALRKTDFARMETVLYVTAEVIRRLTIPALAFIPGSAARLLNFLSVGQDKWLLALAGDEGKLRPGTLLPVPEPVFRRFERARAE